MLHAMNAVSMACMLEPMLWFLALFTYSRCKPGFHSFSFRLYLATQLAASALSVSVFFLLLSSSGPTVAHLLFLRTQISGWGAIFSGVFAIAALRDMLKRLLVPLVGLQRVARITFQWILVVAFFAILNRMIADPESATFAGELATLANGIRLTQLVLLLPLLPFTFIVRRSLRSHLQEVMMGLAILAVSSSVLGVVSHADREVFPGAALVAGHIILVATLIFWICCFVTQEGQDQPQMLLVDSKLVRWSGRLRMLDRASVQREQ